MTLLGLVLAIALSTSGGPTQTSPPINVDLADEPHHSLVLQNHLVRVFRLKLQPNEVTLSHRHKTFYAFLSLRPVTIRNEVRGRPPVVTQVDGGDLHTSKGGFVVAERNTSAEPADLLVIETVKSEAEGKGFSAPMGGFKVHDAALGALLETPVVRAYTMTIAATGHIEQHVEAYDRLMIAVSDLTLRDDVTDQPSSALEMHAGEIRWFPRGLSHATVNVGATPSTFMTLEFN